MVTPIWKQANSSAGFYRPRAGRLENNKMVWMFDNEIDWVIAHLALIPRTGGRKAAGRMSDG
jgi:hypothetical protein